MRFLILTDIHANLEALEAVLERARGRFDQVICCGDLVGYGPDPNEVIEAVRQLDPALMVRGNHDKAAVGLTDLSLFNPLARSAALWTQAQLSEENRRYLQAMTRGPVKGDGFTVAHGSLLDEDQYLLNLEDALQSLSLAAHRLTFFGHTHVQGGFAWFKERRAGPLDPGLRKGAAESRLVLDSENRYLINPGSVGQPRDDDRRAAFAVYDQAKALVSYLRVEYPVGRTQKKMREAGLPSYLADRLRQGW
ncbi:MAG: metallophosphoesterase family protein [Acidobacteriota bacterium]|nr:metallophosphoesterase family protein [Acidobacteriota bacterium]